MARKLIVEIIGDSSNFEKSLSKAGKATTGMGSSLKKMAGFAVLGAGAAGLGGLIVAAKKSIDTANEHAKVYAQTNAVLKSTGDISNTTQGSIQSLANAIEKKSGVDDVAIQSGENMLLTFTRIRNEAGKGNDIFNQSTKTLVDMSTALGTDMSKSAIQLGKALNDPIKGVSALARVGVTFDDSQKKMIKSMVDSGNTMGAQKLILKELNKEFGGSADALGRTLPGQVNILKARLDDLGQSIGTKLVPILLNFVNWINDNWGTISSIAAAVETAISTAFDGIKTAVAAAVSFIQAHWSQITAVFNTVRDAVVTAAAYVEQQIRTHWGAISAYSAQVWNGIRDIVSGTVNLIRAYWERFGPAIIAIVKNTWEQVKSNIQAALNIIKGVINLFAGVLHGDWSRAWQGLKQIASGVLGGIVANIRATIGNALAAARALGKAVLDGIWAGLKGIGAKIADFGFKIFAAINNLASNVLGWAEGIGMGIINGIINGLGGLISRVANAIIDKVTSAIGDALNFLSGSPHITAAVPLGVGIMEGVAKGVIDNVGRVADAISGAIHAAIGRAAARGFADSLADVSTAIVNFTNGVVKILKDNIIARRGEVAAAFSSFSSAATSAFDAVGGSPATRALAKKLKAEQDAQKARQDKEAADARAQRLADAQASLAGLTRNEGESDEDFAKRVQAAKDAVTAAEKEIADAKEQARIDADAKALEEAKKRDKDAFEQQLAELQKQANSAKTADQLAKIKKKIKTLLAQYGITPDSVQAATDWGTAQTLFVGALGDLKKSLDALTDALRKAGGGKIPSFAEGGVMPHTGLAFLHAGETVLTGGDSEYAAALRKAHGKWENPRRWAPDEMRTGAVLRSQLERRYGDRIKFEDAWVQALYNAKEPGGLSGMALVPPPYSIADATWGQVWYDFPGGQYGIPSFGRGGVMPHDGLAYLHAGETVSPGGQEIHVHIGEDTIIARIEDGLVRRGSRGGPLVARVP